MEIETIKTSLHGNERFRSYDCSSLAFDLSSLIETLKRSYTWENGELSALILLKSSEKKIILIGMHEGTEIVSYQSNDSIIVQILEGRLRFHSRKDTVNLNEGQLMTLDEKQKYSLRAFKKTVFLLTISNRIAKASNN